MHARDIKALTGARTKMAGIAILYRRLGDKTWTRGGRAYQLAGYDARKDLVHFTATWAVPGGAAHRRVAISLAEALASDSGDLEHALILH